MTTTDRSIQPLPRSSRSGTVLILASAILLSIIPFSLSTGPWVAAFAVLLVVAAVLMKEIQAAHIALFTTLLAGIPLFHPALHNWPFNLLIPIIAYCALVFAVRRLRRSLLWLKTGHMRKDIAVIIIATAVISSIALYIWYYLAKPDLSLHLGYMPSMPLWLFPLAGFGFALGNAAMEEFVFRGVIMQATDSALGAGRSSILVQAWLFGAMHFLHGFPNGWWGLSMTFVYGVMLGAIRRQAQGMLAPWIAHACADLVIFTILAMVAQMQ